MLRLPHLLASILWLGSALPAASAGNLYLYTWTDYTSPELIRKFQQETGITVTVDTFDSNETLLARLKSGSTGYDIVIASSDFIPIFIDQRLIQKIEAAKWADYPNIEARWRSPAWDRGNDYSVPYAWGVTSFLVNTRKVKAPADSLKLLFEPPPEAAGKVGMLSAPTEVISQAQMFLGQSPCQTDVAAMKKVSAVLEGQKPNVKVYASDGTIERAASGETWIQQTWNGDGARARLANPDLRFVFPKEGVVAWMDSMAVPTSAKNPENAKRFMQFLLKPENAAATENFTHYASAISGIEPFLDPSLRDAPELKVPRDIKMSFSPPCPEAAIKLIDRVWTRLRR